MDNSKEGTYKNRLKCAFSDKGLKQIVNDYTRVTESTKTIIDYPACSENHKISNHLCS